MYPNRTDMHHSYYYCYYCCWFEKFSPRFLFTPVFSFSRTLTTNLCERKTVQIARTYSDTKRLWVCVRMTLLHVVSCFQVSEKGKSVYECEPYVWVWECVCAWAQTHNKHRAAGRSENAKNLSETNERTDTQTTFSQLGPHQSVLNLCII